MPTDRFAELAQIAANQHGLFTLDDARGVGYAKNTIAQMARRRRLDRTSQGVYRIPFLAPGPWSGYMQAALWPQGAKGVLTHATALDLWDVSDVNPATIHITVPRTHRPQRDVPPGYTIHREDLRDDDISAFEGIPVVTLERAIRECAADHLATDLLEQATRTGRGRGLLTAAEADGLMRDLGLDRVAASRA